MFFENDVLEVKSAFIATINSYAPPLAPLAEKLMSSIGAPSWALEWNLPYWLGVSFRVPEKPLREIALFNAFGLGFVRIADDLADAESPWADGAAEARSTDENGRGAISACATDYFSQEALALQIVLQHLASMQVIVIKDAIIDAHADISGPHAAEEIARDFVRSFTEYMNQWLHATFFRNKPSNKRFCEYTERDFIALSNRGALLKTCCAAVCCMSGHQNSQEVATKAIDNLLAACVLLDHINDWVPDINAGRYNAFVAWCLDNGQANGRYATESEKILAKLFFEQADPYLDVVHQFLCMAGGNAAMLGCEGLAAYVTLLIEETSQYRERMRNQIKAQTGTITSKLRN